jgi:hypothetical protein
MRAATSTAAPERVRWPRLAATSHPEPRSLLPQGYAGLTEATAPRHLVLPATTAVPLIVKLLDSVDRPPQFVMGAHGAYSVLEGDCAPSYLEAWLAPLGPTPCWGCPWTSPPATPSTWLRCWAPTAGAWPSSSATPPSSGRCRWQDGHGRVGLADRTAKVDGERTKVEPAPDPDALPRVPDQPAGEETTGAQHDDRPWPKGVPHPGSSRVPHTVVATTASTNSATPRTVRTR